MRRGIPVLCTSRIYEDPALSWARSHSIEAQACLNVPKFTTKPPVDLERYEPDRPIRSWKLEDYLLHRNWHTDNEHQRTLISHVLSAPLTISNILSTTKPNTVACLVGARAEASLPPHHWLELLELLRLHKNLCRRLELHFTGPELIRRPDVSMFTQAQSNSSVTLKWHAPCKFHELDDELVSSFDVLIFLNPGFGHPNLTIDWKPTLPLTKPSLITAHSELDAERDRKFLSSMYDMEVDYKTNPFASRIKYLDPVSNVKGHFVQPNFLYGIYHPS